MHNPGELWEVTVESNVGPIGVNGTVQFGNKDGAASLESSGRPRQGQGRRAGNLIKRLCIWFIQKGVSRSNDEGPNDHAGADQRDSPRLGLQEPPMDRGLVQSCVVRAQDIRGPSRRSAYAKEIVRAHDDGTVDESHDGNGWSWRPCWTRWPRSFQIRRHGRLMHHSTTYAWIHYVFRRNILNRLCFGYVRILVFD